MADIDINLREFEKREQDNENIKISLQYSSSQQSSRFTYNYSKKIVERAFQPNKTSRVAHSVAKNMFPNAINIKPNMGIGEILLDKKWITNSKYDVVDACKAQQINILRRESASNLSLDTRYQASTPKELAKSTNKEYVSTDEVEKHFQNVVNGQQVSKVGICFKS